MNDRKKALISGASSGIGRATAIRFAREGWDVCLNARRAKKLTAVKMSLPAGDHLVCPGDYSEESVGGAIQDAIQANPTSSPPLIFDRTLCDRCEHMDCIRACLNQALEVAGREYTLNALMLLLHRDQDYWGEGGGVTFGGGEPLMQADFLLAALERCRSNYIHTAVETSAHAPTEILIQALRLADWVFFDLKHCDSAAHRDGTGVGNELILQNLEVVAAARADCRLIVRVPIVPLFNDAPENLRATADLMRKLDLKEVNLLPFHRLASSKYQQLGLDYAYAHVPPPSKAMMLSHQSIFTQAGLLCYLGANTPF